MAFVPPGRLAFNNCNQGNGLLEGNGEDAERSVYASMLPTRSRADDGGAGPRERLVGCHGSPGDNINCKPRLTVNVILAALRDVLSEILLFLSILQ